MVPRKKEDENPPEVTPPNPEFTSLPPPSECDFDPVLRSPGLWDVEEEDEEEEEQTSADEDAEVPETKVVSSRWEPSHTPHRCASTNGR